MLLCSVLPGDDPSAFCANCTYEVLDVLAKEIFEEMKRLNADSEMLSLYQKVMGSQLGHLVDLLDKAKRWRAGGSVEEFIAAIDEALDKESVPRAG